MSKEERAPIEPAVVRRYLDNQGSYEDKLKIQEWFDSPASAEKLAALSFPYWEEIPLQPEVGDYDEERMLDRINHLLRIEDAKAQKEKQGRRKWLRYAQKIAAGLFIPLLLWSGLQWLGFFDGVERVAESSIYAPLGARTSFRLPDGSKGWLNSGSTLHFPARFSGERRAVRLEGEGFFDIVSDSTKPFVVETEKMQVVAFGTSFNVNAYKEDKTSSVILESGVVELFKSEDTGWNNTLSRLDTGYQFTYFKDLDSYQTQTVDIYKNTAWKEGLLVFREDALVDIVDRLNRWYNVEITIQDKRLETHTFRATFKDETLDEVLKLLKLSSPIKIEEVGREILDDNTFGKRKINLSL